MKYCGECGNQLMDEAVRCPNCGASATTTDDHADKIKRANNQTRLKTGAALNNIAGVVNVLIALFLGWVLFGSPPVESGADDGFSIGVDMSGGAPHPELFWLWLATILFVYAIGLYALRRIDRGAGSTFAYLYMLSAILSVIVMNTAFPNALYFLFCFIGIIFFVPLILQLVAGVKMLQGAK